MKLSFSKIRELLCEAIQPTNPNPGIMSSTWVVEVFEDELIYHKSGKLYKAPYRISDDQKVELGSSVEVIEDTDYKPVFSEDILFAASSVESDDGETVIREGLLFEGGNFPDKNVSFDEADVALAVADFAPVPNDLEHKDTILDGKLGILKSVRNEGLKIFGKVELPMWLHKTIGDNPIKVSLAFDRNKRIVGNALVLRPRIPDAAIVSAFSLATPLNKEPLKLQDTKPMKLKLSDAIKHIFGIDKVSDLDVEVTLPEGSVPYSNPVTPAAPVAPAAPIAAPVAPNFSETSPEVLARFAAMERQLLSEKAFAFADDVIRNKKALPAQREAVATMYGQAVSTDAKGGSLFSTETQALVEGPSVAALRTFFSSAPSHAFAGEAFVNDTAVLLFGKGGGSGGGMTEARKQELLNKSDLGRKAAGA